MRNRSRWIGRAVPACLIVLVAAATRLPGDDWPQFRGPRRDGISGETGLMKSWPETGLDVLWRTRLGEGFSGLSVVNGRIFTMFGSRGDEFATAIEADTGQEIWRFRVDSKWVDMMGNGPRSTPTVDEGRVFVLSAKGMLHALNADNGESLWSRNLGKDFGAKPPQWGRSTSPLVEGSLLLVDVGGHEDSSIVAFDKKTGEEVWRSQEDRAGYSSPITVTIGGVRQVLFFTARNLVSLAPADGSLYWKVPWKTSYEVNAAVPVFVAPDKVFVSSGYGKGSVLLRVNGAGDKAAVEEIWRSREMKNHFSSSVLHDGHLYGFDDKTLKCVDVATGETVWRKRGLGHGTLLLADGHLIVLGDHGGLVLVEATAEEYRERGQTRMFKGKTWTMPTLVGGKLYLRDESELLSVDVSSQG